MSETKRIAKLERENAYLRACEEDLRVIVLDHPSEIDEEELSELKAAHDRARERFLAPAEAR